ncbi:hypothetical protein AOT82_412 [Psychrobacter sp. AntiMn-1]|nr:hypothetical protein AOT82_412 [Psychrobacter sp. AntiMn-1]
MGDGTFFYHHRAGKHTENNYDSSNLSEYSRWSVVSSLTPYYVNPLPVR